MPKWAEGCLSGSRATTGFTSWLSVLVTSYAGHGGCLGKGCHLKARLRAAALQPEILSIDSTRIRRGDSF